MNGFLIHTAVTAVALWAATQLVPGIHVAGLPTLLLAAVIFGVVNAVVRPVAVVLSLPLTILTLGLFLLVVNAAMLGLTALLLPGMQVRGFGAALLGSIVISVVSWLVARLVGERAVRR